MVFLFGLEDVFIDLPRKYLGAREIHAQFVLIGYGTADLSLSAILSGE